MGLELDLDKEKLETIVSAAIFQTIDQNKRDILIKDAIRHLMTPQKSDRLTYGTPKSPISEAFEYAIRNVAIKVCGEMLAADPTVQDKLKTLINEALEGLMTTYRAATVEKLANAIAAGMAYRERD
jgi:hypothetical protein